MPEVRFIRTVSSFSMTGQEKVRFGALIWIIKLIGPHNTHGSNSPSFSFVLSIRTGA